MRRRIAATAGWVARQAHAQAGDALTPALPFLLLAGAAVFVRAACGGGEWTDVD